MTKSEIGGLVALVVAVTSGAVAFGNLEGRISGIEREIDQPKKVMRDEGQRIIEEADGIREDILRKTETIESNVGENRTAISSLGENDCKWMNYLSRVPLENIQYCPDGFYAKGLGFSHEASRVYAHQMSYRLYCCSLK